jgi:hypothetical protein
LRKERINVEPIADNKVAVLLVAGLKKYDDALMQEFKEKLSVHTVITRGIDK